MACRRVRLKNEVRERVIEQFRCQLGVAHGGDLMRSGLREEKLV